MLFAGLLVAAYLLFGVDLEPVFSEHEITSFPVPFIKRQPSLSIITSLPIEPYRVMYADLNIPPEKRKALQTYCSIRFGEEEKACLGILEKRLKDNGFYKAE
jgi:hypothetical protein